MERKVILGASRLQSVIRRQVSEITDYFNQYGGWDDLMIVGIRDKGVALGERIAKELEDDLRKSVPFGILDVTHYRDDLTTLTSVPVTEPTKLPDSIDDKIILLVIDVFFTGRTIRAALDALIDFGRPRMILVAALVTMNVGHERDMPIRVRFGGKSILVNPGQRLKISLLETDNKDEVVLLKENVHSPRVSTFLDK